MEEVKKNKKFFFLFFCLLGLTLLLPQVSIAQDIETIDVPPDTNTYYANSELPVYGGYTIEKAWLKYPARCKIYIRNPSGDIVYASDEKTDGITETETHYLVYVKDRGLRIPAFASSGSWKVELVFYSKYAGDLENVIARGVYTLRVGESSLLDHAIAPLYWYWDIFGFLASGDEISIGLPGIMYLSAIVWVPLIVIVMVKYFRGTLSIGKKVYKKSKTEVKKT